MDFITQLPKSASGYDAVVVFVDRLTKMVHIAPTMTTATAQDTAELFVHHVVRLHGLPISMVSDRDSKFTSKFWEAVWPLLGTQLHRSSAFHPQSDGQTERVNKVFEDTIRHFVSPFQDDWDKYIDAAEFAINNAHHESVGNTPFFLNTGQHPLTPVTRELDTHVPAAAVWLANLHGAVRSAKRCLEAAQQRMKAQADTSRRDVPLFNPGDLVLLNTKHLHLKNPGTKKLLPKWIGPFPVLGHVNEVAVRIELPPSLRVHNVFHVSLVKAYFPNRTVQPPPPTMLFEDGTMGYNVAMILGHREVKRGRRIRREFLVNWEGYGQDHNSYEPEEHFEGNTVLAEYLARQNMVAPVAV